METRLKVQASNKYIEIIQVFRAMAAIGIMLLHAEYGLYKSCGWGVNFFFILSGYTWMLSTSKNSHGGGYWKRKLCRFVPIYYCMTLVEIVGYMLFPDGFRSVIVNPETVIKSLLFIPCYAGNGNIRPVYGLGWTLNLELYFYLIAFIAMKTSYKHRKVIISVILLVLFSLGKVLQFQSAILRFWTSQYLLCFVVGIWIYELSVKFAKTHVIFNDKITLALIIGILGILFFNGYIFGIENRFWVELFLNSVLLIVGLTAYRERNCNKLLVILGNMSYSIYMTHFFVIGFLCRVVMKDTNITLMSTLIVLLALVLAIISSWVAYQIFEVRLAPWLLQKMTSKKEQS